MPKPSKTKRAAPGGKTDAAVLAVRVTPNAAATELAGWELEGDRPVLLVRLAAPPVDGKANAELVRFLTKELGCPKMDVAVVRGSTGRDKVVALPTAALERLLVTASAAE